MLQAFVAGAGGMMHPMRLGSVVPMLCNQGFFTSELADEHELAAWQKLAAQVEATHFLVLAWNRSRVPGYPILRAPQIARGSTLSEPGTFSHRFPWTVEERRMGLQNFHTPSKFVAQLGLVSEGNFDEAAHSLIESLTRSDAWRAFEEAHSALDEGSKKVLKLARAELATRLSPESVDAYEEHRFFDRNAFREHEMAQIVDNLDGRANAYAEAFAGLDSLLTLVLCDVFGQLVSRHEIKELRPDELSFPEVEFVEFTVDDPDWHLQAGQIVWLDDPAVPDAVRVEEAHFRFDTLEARVTCRARRLNGSGQAWGRPTPAADSPAGPAT